MRGQFPDEPWRWRLDWAEGRAAADARRDPRCLLVVAVVWCAAAGVGSWSLWSARDAAPLVAKVLVGGLLPGIAALALAVALRRLALGVRFGRPPLTLEPLPAWLGADLRAHLDCPRSAGNQPAFTATLSYLIRQRMSPAPGHRLIEVESWTGEASVDVQPSPIDQARVRVNIVVPLPTSVDAPAERETRWVLHVRTRPAVLGFDERYQVPVAARPA